MKCLILLMYGATMKLIDGVYPATEVINLPLINFVSSLFCSIIMES